MGSTIEPDVSEPLQHLFLNSVDDKFIKDTALSHPNPLECFRYFIANPQASELHASLKALLDYNPSSFFPPATVVEKHHLLVKGLYENHGSDLPDWFHAQVLKRDDLKDHVHAYALQQAPIQVVSDYLQRDIEKLPAVPATCGYANQHPSRLIELFQSRNIEDTSSLVSFLSRVEVVPEELLHHMVTETTLEVTRYVLTSYRLSVDTLIDMLDVWKGKPGFDSLWSVIENFSDRDHQTALMERIVSLYAPEAEVASVDDSTLRQYAFRFYTS